MFFSNMCRKQLELKAMLVAHDDLQFDVPQSTSTADPSSPLRLIGGVDISFVKDN